MSNNCGGNIGANENDDGQQADTPAGFSKSIQILADSYTCISQNRGAQSQEANLFNIKVDKVGAGEAGNPKDKTERSGGSRENA